MTALKESDYKEEESLAGMKNIYPELKNNPVYLINYGQMLHFSGNYQDAISIFQTSNYLLSCYLTNFEMGNCYDKLGKDEKAIMYWQIAADMIPSRFAPEHRIIKKLFETGKTAEALEKSAVFLKKEKKIDHPAVYEMQEEIKTLIRIHSQ